MKLGSTAQVFALVMSLSLCLLYSSVRTLDSISSQLCPFQETWQTLTKAQTAEKDISARQRPIMTQITEEDLSGVIRLSPSDVHVPVVEDRFWALADDCVPSDWRDQSHPTCNYFHEIDLLANSPKRLGAGTTREVWEIDEYDGSKVALKTLRAFFAQNEYGSFTTEKNRKDAVVSAELSSSRYIVDIYGYCCSSSLVELADAGLPRLPLPKNQLLKAARDIAMGLADLHHVSITGYVIQHMI